MPIIRPIRDLVMGCPPLNFLALRAFYPHLKASSRSRIPFPRSFSYGENVRLEERSTIYFSQDGTLSLGDKCIISADVVLNACGTLELCDEVSVQRRCYIEGHVRIGRYTLLAPNVFIASGPHNFDVTPAAYIRDQDNFVLSGRASREHHSPIKIGEDCWLGINAVVMPGITIGKGCIVGANSVVTRNISPYTVAGGIPARPIKKRLDFRPPGRLRADVLTDLPYFYEGFRLSEKERQQDLSEHNGVVAAAQFSIMLDDAPRYDRIAILAHSLTGRPERLTLGLVSVELPVRPTWISLALRAPRLGPLDFVFTSLQTRRAMSITEVRLLTPEESVQNRLQY